MSKQENIPASFVLDANKAFDMAITENKLVLDAKEAFDMAIAEDKLRKLRIQQGVLDADEAEDMAITENKLRKLLAPKTKTKTLVAKIDKEVDTKYLGYYEVIGRIEDFAELFDVPSTPLTGLAHAITMYAIAKKMQEKGLL